jgi:ABC-type phosphate transport system permease subunit
MFAIAMMIVLVGIGFGLVMLGWGFFRRPGVAFWTFAPVWRANRYLKPPGAALWIAGCVVALAGVLYGVFGRA